MLKLKNGNIRLWGIKKHIFRWLKLNLRGKCRFFFKARGSGSFNFGLFNFRFTGKNIVITGTFERAYLPPLLCDDHLCLMPVKLEPQGPVAQIHLRLPRYQSCLRRGELVKSASLIRVSILLRVRVASSRVALRRSVGQKAVVSSIRYDRVMGHVAAGTSNRKRRVRRSVLARVREHGTGRCWDWLCLGRWRKDAPFSCRSIEIMTDVRDSVKIRREFAPLYVPWCVLGVGKIVCLWLIRHLPRVFFQGWTSLQVVTCRYNRMVLQRELWSIGDRKSTAHVHKFLGEITRRRDAILELHISKGSHY